MRVRSIMLANWSQRIGEMSEIGDFEAVADDG